MPPDNCVNKETCDVETKNLGEHRERHEGMFTRIFTEMDLLKNRLPHNVTALLAIMTGVIGWFIRDKFGG